MNEPLPRPRSRAEQRRASDPSLSAFVSANAGSGKTTVLVERVLRLLLDGAAPSKILCLTYTKAAAATMALKAFERLGEWTGLDEPALRDALTALDGQPPDRARLGRARRLFARAVETPGGLKIETIHAFCERILHLFPFEANVPARFDVLDEAESEKLLTQALAPVLVEAARGTRADLAAALTLVGLEVAGDRFDDAIRAAVKEREFLRDGLKAFDGLPRAMAELGRALGLGDGETLAAIERAMLEDGLEPPEWHGIAQALRLGRKTDQACADALLAACTAASPAERLRCYLEVFFTQKGEPRQDSGFPTKAIDAVLGARLRAERDRLDGLWERRKCAALVARTGALHTLGGAIAERFEALKNARGALDYDDLITRAHSLFMRADAAWVLYKLDAGIDHVLVDEAQDTNPAQWQILKALTVDFSAGAGARATRRTVFAVGDPKQSIFGFQGARPREFEASGRYFRARIEAAGETFAAVPLRVSFRSAPAVLAAVDAVFGIADHFEGLGFALDASARPGTIHESSRFGAHGRVELWPLVRPADTPAPDAWRLPRDEPEPNAPPLVLARRIAGAVKRWTTAGDETGRVLPPGEILVLVRKRGVLFEAIIRALREAGVPVAGADRLTLGEHIAVMDLLAAGRAALLPDDDLSLATALKSPLVGLGDDDLIRIGARRASRASLAEALAGAAMQGDAAARRGHARLQDWRRLAARQSPFGFYAALLGPAGGRRAFLSRLGAEAGDAVDEFLSMALAHERRQGPSLAAFLAHFGDASREVKRDMDAGTGEVRVMTVHGAKGLEAGAVILANPCRLDPREPILLPCPIDVAGGSVNVPVWIARKQDLPKALLDRRQAQDKAAREEHNRLLYVAMTRAKDRLVVAPHIGTSPNKPPDACWPAMIREGLSAPVGEAVVAAHPDAGEPMLVWESGTPSAAEAPGAPSPSVASEPVWLRRPVAAEVEPIPPFRPSGALGAADARGRPGDGPFAADARLAGVLAHTLLQHLPGLAWASRPAAAERYLVARAGHLPASTRERLAAATLAVLAAPALAPLFAPASRAEVPVAGRLDLVGFRPVSVSGQIDRLAITEEGVLMADFKTTARPPEDVDDVPESHLVQLAIYRALLARVFAGKPVRAFLVYTAGALVLEPPAARLDKAIATFAAHAAAARAMQAGVS